MLTDFFFLYGVALKEMWIMLKSSLGNTDLQDLNFNKYNTSYVIDLSCIDVKLIFALGTLTFPTDVPEKQSNQSINAPICHYLKVVTPKEPPWVVLVDAV